MAKKQPGENPEHQNTGSQTMDQARLVIAVENTAEAIIITDIEGNIQYVNPAFEKITGYSRAEALSQNITLLDSGQNDPSFFEQMWDCLKRGEVWRGRFINRKKDNSLYQSDSTISPVKNTAGQIINYVSVQRDVTREIQLEKQLRQAQKMEAIGTLAGGIAHDFNNLLLGIQGNISLSLLDLASESPIFSSLKKIEQYVQNGVELTRRLLGFARGGKYQVRLTDFNRLLIEQNLLFSRANKAVVFKEEFDTELWNVEADQDQIEQVILNIYMNALQAMPEGGTLTVRTENITIDEERFTPYRVKAGDYVKISVIDTGIGMDEKTQGRIFDPFFTTREMGRGTGLGLASVYGIIKNHEGFINVESQKSRGTQIEIFLPASRKHAPSKQLPSDELTCGRETVLLVDDEEMIVDVGKRMLDKLGYETLTAMNGTEALEIYKTRGKDISLVILDMVMPKVSGGETYDRLKQINPAIKVILCSGYSIDGQATEILKRGCNAFIQKPFNLKTLSQHIRAMLDDEYE
ncbi:MAG: response regulator [Desulfobacteraceae bacterium]|jgi:PAS domain S-box-containing protein|nr:response regulator [Desulfobacteraceae bacterium]